MRVLGNIAGSLHYLGSLRKMMAIMMRMFYNSKFVLCKSFESGVFTSIAMVIVAKLPCLELYIHCHSFL